jgi:DNA gyrase subunit A
MVTQKGTIKKTTLEAYSRPRANGINSMNVREGDTLVEAKLTNGTSEIIIASREGKAIRFNESGVRPMGRNATGVRSIRLADGDEVIGMVSIEDPKTTNVLVVSENGMGKRTEVEAYRITKRGGKGVMAMNVTDKTGKLVSIKEVDDTNDIMIINKSGITIRLSVSSLRVLGRVTQGVRLINIGGKDEIASVAKINYIPGDEEADAVDTEEGEIVEGFEVIAGTDKDIEDVGPEIIEEDIEEEDDTSDDE